MSISPNSPDEKRWLHIIDDVGSAHIYDWHLKLSRLRTVPDVTFSSKDMIGAQTNHEFV